VVDLKFHKPSYNRFILFHIGCLPL
jgi:hypothetical protein